MSYAMEHPLAIYAVASERAAFIRRTYAHLAGAILAFTAIEFAVFNLLSLEDLHRIMLVFFGSTVSQLILLAAFIGVGWLARMWAMNGGSRAMQYTGLSLYVLFEAFIFIPILTVAIYYVPAPHNKTILPTAGIMTLSIFGGLTLAVFTTRKDFSFLRGILSMGGFLMLGLIVAAMLFPASLSLGLWFSFLGVALACGFILYDTSNVIHHFRTDQHVAAALDLFASVAYLFYHILRILILLANNRD